MLSLIKSCHKYWNILVLGRNAGGTERKDKFYSMSSHAGDHPGKYTPGGMKMQLFAMCYRSTHEDGKRRAAQFIF